MQCERCSFIFSSFLFSFELHSCCWPYIASRCKLEWDFKDSKMFSVVIGKGLSALSSAAWRPLFQASSQFLIFCYAHMMCVHERIDLSTLTSEDFVAFDLSVDGSWTSLRPWLGIRNVWEIYNYRKTILHELSHLCQRQARLSRENLLLVGRRITISRVTIFQRIPTLLFETVDRLFAVPMQRVFEHVSLKLKNHSYKK